MDVEWHDVFAAVWRRRTGRLRPVRNIDPVSLGSLIGIDEQKQRLDRNTHRFLTGQPANNALLWGARGTGKSSLIKALLNAYGDQRLRLVEVNRDDLMFLPEIVDELRELPYRFLVFCDDLTFEPGETAYVGLKSVLEGSIEQPPENMLLYATSNRRHLLPEYQRENQGVEVQERELHYSDAVEEKISLSDRFGLWLSFYQGTLDDYLRIVDSYFPDYPGDRRELHEAARLFALSRASRSGRTARQFYNHYAGAEDS